MPRRNTGLRRRVVADAGAITPEQVEVLITGDLEGGAIIPTAPDLSGPPFTGIEHARAVWKQHQAHVLDIFRNGHRPEHGRATLLVQDSPWLRDKSRCWALDQFGTSADAAHGMPRASRSKPVQPGDDDKPNDSTAV